MKNTCLTLNQIQSFSAFAIDYHQKQTNTSCACKIENFVSFKSDGSSLSFYLNVKKGFSFLCSFLKLHFLYTRAVLQINVLFDLTTLCCFQLFIKCLVLTLDWPVLIMLTAHLVCLQLRLPKCKCHTFNHASLLLHNQQMKTD